MTEQEYQKVISLEDGSIVALLASGDLTVSDSIKNIVRVAENGQIIWRVAPGEGVDGNTPFTNIYWDENHRLRAFRFDGFEYLLNLDTGLAEIIDFLK